MPLLITWKQLKALGWPYSRVDTWRKMRAGKFPQCVKLYEDRNSHPVWPYADIIKFLKSRGININPLPEFEVE
jgi:predicted DNA-binding transcriptional regulator AlpA